ncbi:decaprenylphospho-beta-D-erythro-pentofuranosid-2-ulose 2-reductase [Corynebacterium sp. 153RC1]|uniref:decaprenylphospho-beta-D-erythro-pentofuranosid- 2-ulose 2-reductase n=1 Tax=unclassified Corynebacterium TaxID=2624378 RepID=UPI00211BC02E|nr:MULTISPECIES: decaprenylphospho-beta-D-erythro-pentofuranosid-2-ulose 2-reductase [unclassified Corynebacterium]MCQ9370791.1 decaprenylphospho-beta-D-erythro-pentofuranosid-2-ulose 2-reductase [Corynebacterium sp. 35RC1]MCQ9352843.1 decaprenylphospho-beta-D-erythro-pentofuranosid-2-ulose 2-reductase [Corynebacterium sp. 209RC1]MCQ9355235.1 decaprenylphospho-beta-D-erythro-pentofuranosid-2-ulose 2-reductase [Corynebacterium sp. 1222RC1]MCQ9357422.1 decaprenylphospho-beta-D-erythro-pentofurano
MLNAVGQAQNIVLLGGTSEIGLAIVSEFLKKGPAKVTLAAREDSPRIEAAREEITAAGASEVKVVPFDATNFASHQEAVDEAFADGDVDVAIVAFGSLGDQEQLWQDQQAAVASAETNFTAPVSVGVLLGQKFKEQGHGSIVALSSVAGQRVRRSNFVYGAAKAGMDAFYLNLGEALREHGVNVLVVRPGQVRTKMTEGMSEAPLTVNREDVAKATVQAVLDKRGAIFVHPLFEYVSLAFKFIPQAIFRKLPF